ncbi:MAG: site-2 protease family protein, partial [Bacteroidota bacterium]
MGVLTVNLILAMFIYAMILFVYGEKYIATENIKHGIWCVDSVATNIGLKNGDKIISVDGKKIERFNDVTLEMLYAKNIEVNRNGETIRIEMPTGLTGKLVDSKSRMLVAPRIPFYVAKFTKGSNAEKAGIKLKDKIVGVNGQQIQFFDEFKPLVSMQKGKEINIQVLREGKEISIPVKVSADGLIGVGQAGLIEMDILGEMKLNTQKFGFFESFPAGINLAIEQLSKYVRQFKLILNPETGAYKGVGSFLSIGNLFSSEWDWESFWGMTAMLSVVLAFMNILPIPALDGGHVMFLLYEVITRRKPSDKVMEYAQYVGMFLLISLMVYALGNDIFRLF